MYLSTKKKEVQYGQLKFYSTNIQLMMQPLNETIRRRAPTVPQRPSELLVAQICDICELAFSFQLAVAQNNGSVSLLYHSFS